MEDTKAQDAELTDRIAKMNRAPDDKKMAVMATVLTHLVEVRTAMNARKATMDAEMMTHMMRHMQMGKESMPMCPMMKGMKGMKDMEEESGAAYNEHPEEKK